MGCCGGVSGINGGIGDPGNCGGGRLGCNGGVVPGNCGGGMSGWSGGVVPGNCGAGDPGGCCGGTGLGCARQIPEVKTMGAKIKAKVFVTFGWLWRFSTRKSAVQDLSAWCVPPLIQLNLQGFYEAVHASNFVSLQRAQ